MQNTMPHAPHGRPIRAGTRYDEACPDRASCRPGSRAQCHLQFHFSFIESTR
ncbi:MAG: hypothetical protein V4673_15855 [Pseudomonadota bacterium]